MSYSSTLRILKNDLKLFPYKIQVKQKLTNGDQTARVDMCNWFLEKTEQNGNRVNNVWFSDEVHFHLDGVVNSRNNVFWGTQVPDEVSHRPLHSAKVTAWCALSSIGIIGPFWFQDDQGKTTTVNQKRYQQVIRKFSRSLKRGKGVILKEQWFMQDGAAPHAANDTVKLLREKIEERIISRRTENPWAPHSPDLNPLDFFLWGYAKDNVFKSTPKNLEDLKASITSFVRRIPVDMCKRVVDNFITRINVCLERNGRHIEHTL